MGESKGLVKFSVCSLIEPNFSMECSALVLSRLGHNMPSNRIDPTPYSDFLGLSLADPKFYEPGSIDIIIGADLYGSLLRNELKRSKCGDSTAQNTHLGWVVYGRLPVGVSRQLSAKLCATTTAELNTLVQQMWKFNQMDDISSPSKMTEDEIYCEEFLNERYAGTTSVGITYGTHLKRTPTYPHYLTPNATQSNYMLASNIVFNTMQR